MIAYRDDSNLPDGLPKKVKGFGTTYYETELVSARRKMKEWKNKTYDARQRMFESEKKKEVARIQKYIEDRKADAVRYDTMIVKVQAWNPPEKLKRLKDFMVQQLEESKKFDCSCSYSMEELERWHTISFEEWSKEYVSDLRRDISRCSDEIEKENTRQAERQDWVDTLRAEFESPNNG